jgi:mycofactocin glycosyltransferase
MDGLAPAHLGVKIAPGVLLREAGRTVIGGHPLRILRLADAGGARVRAWASGAPVGDGRAVRRLARRLLDSGILITFPGSRTIAPDQVEAVVPVHGQPPAFARCLSALAVDGIATTVVDDGSDDPAAIAAVARDHRARLVRLPTKRGAAAARNVGFSASLAPFVAFVDADVVVTPGWLSRLLPHFDDPSVAIVAPRVLSLVESRGGGLAGYESRHSTLDMGPTAGVVGSGRLVPYVPSAAMLIRRHAFGEGFNENLPIGEDVDLCLRTSAAGWRVVYDPETCVRHDHRVRWQTFLRRRWEYGGSIGPLARSHPDALPALRANPVTAAAVGLLALGAPAPAGMLLGIRAVGLHRRIGSRRLATELALRDLSATVHAAARAARCAWAPVLLVAGVRSGRVRRVLAAAVALRAADTGLTAGDLPIALTDDLVASVATLASCIQHSTFRPLAVALGPQVSRRHADPGRQGPVTSAPIIKEAVGGSI